MNSEGLLSILCAAVGHKHSTRTFTGDHVPAVHPSGSPTMHAFAFICLAAATPNAWALLDARAMRRGREAGKNRRLSDDFSERVKMVASDAAASDWFGYSVAIDGSTIVVVA